MPEIKIIVKGYAKKLANGWVANSNVCLITAGDKRIIVDPGCNREKLLTALGKEGLETKDIDYVFITHAHPDHGMLAGLFENAKSITWDTKLTYDNDQITEWTPDMLGPDIKILETPGHMLEHISLLVTTEKGKVAIAGDVIFWTDDEEQIFKIDQPDHSQAKGMNMEDLIESRKKLVELADYIIPGHGNIFKVNK